MKRFTLILVAVAVCSMLSAQSVQQDLRSSNFDNYDNALVSKDDDSEEGSGWLKETFNIWPKVGISALPINFEANGNKESLTKVIPTIGVDIELKMPWIDNLFLHSNPTYYIINLKEQVGVFIIPTELDLQLHSVSIPLGFRYQYPIQDKGLLFANIGFEVLYDQREDLTITPPATKVFVDSKNTMIYGLGFKKNEWSLELEYKPSYTIFNGSVATSLSRIGLRIGYQIF